MVLDDPLYMISIVAQMLDIHPQTLRLYEKEGFIKPSRTQGNTRLYSQKDIEILKMIRRLTRDLGINLAGVEVILELRERIEEMQKEIDELRTLSEEKPNMDSRNQEETKKQSLVKSPSNKITKIKIIKED